MTTDRRTFLHHASLGSIAGAFAALTPELLSQAQGQATSGSSNGIDQSVLDFWTSKVRNPYQAYLDNIEWKGDRNPGPSDSTFVFPSSKGLVPVGSLRPTDVESFPDSGDMDISVHVERFRPSAADSAALENLQTGTLRIDVKQVAPMVGLPEALAWTAMATLASKQKGQPVPTLDNVKFDPGTVWGQFQSIPLTGGLGFWSWNFFMKKRDGFWAQLLDQFFKVLGTVQPLLPLLGLPGIAVSGLKYIDQIVGAVQAQGQSQWMFKGLDIAVCANKKAYNDAGADGSRKLLLTNGSYIILPELSVGKLDKDLVIQDGLLVPPKTPPLQIYNAATKVLPDVSYMTISVAVTPSKTKTAAPSA